MTQVSLGIGQSDSLGLSSIVPLHEQIVHCTHSSS